MGNILIHCIGCQPLEMSSGSLEVKTGDYLLLSSDGLHHEVREDQILSILNQKTDLKTKCKNLLAAALKAGGRDNVTLVGLLILFKDAREKVAYGSKSQRGSLQKGGRGTLW